MLGRTRVRFINLKSSKYSLAYYRVTQPTHLIIYNTVYNEFKQNSNFAVVLLVLKTDLIIVYSVTFNS